ncbi:MAG: hypothetical protein GY854_19190, partial [Deltaproteobacteria bacterium]|nr:hypothetical protein [Deltaproteobacteria bacterium]
LYLEGTSIPLANLVFSENTTGKGGDAPTAGDGGFGGGLYTDSSSIPTLTTSTFVDNATGSGGAGTSAGAGGEGGGLYNASSTNLALVNSIFWGNTATGTVVNQQLAGVVSYTYCCVQDGMATEHNTNKDPLLDTYWVPQSGSDCVDTGNSNALPADAADVDGDDDTSEELPLDRAGQARISGGDVDMGALELQQ